MADWCKCIMREHCEHECGPEREGRCRLQKFGTAGEGSPGVAGPPGPTDTERLDSLLKGLQEERDRLSVEAGRVGFYSRGQIRLFLNQTGRLSKLIEEHRNG